MLIFSKFINVKYYLIYELISYTDLRSDLLCLSMLLHLTGLLMNSKVHELKLQ